MYGAQNNCNTQASSSLMVYSTRLLKSTDSHAGTADSANAAKTLFPSITIKSEFFESPGTKVPAILHSTSIMPTDLFHVSKDPFGYCAMVVTNHNQLMWNLKNRTLRLRRARELANIKSTYQWLGPESVAFCCPKWVVFRQNIIHNLDMQSPLSSFPLPPSLPSLLPSLPPFFLSLQKTPRQTENKSFGCLG